MALLFHLKPDLCSTVNLMSVSLKLHSTQEHFLCFLSHTYDYTCLKKGNLFIFY